MISYWDNKINNHITNLAYESGQQQTEGFAADPTRHK